MSKINDQQLEWYWLTKQDLEKIKKEKEYSLNEVKKSLKMQWLLEDLFGVKITDTDLLLALYDLLYVNVQRNIKEKGWQISKVAW